MQLKNFEWDYLEDDEKKVNVLLIDNSISNIYLKQDLEETYNYNVTWLRKFDNVFNILDNENIDILIFEIINVVPDNWDRHDFKLTNSGLDTGIVFFHKLRQKYPYIPVIFLTSRDDFYSPDKYTIVLRKPEFISVIVNNIKNLIK